MTAQDILNVHDFILEKQAQYAAGLECNDRGALLESADELGNAYYLLGHRTLAEKWGAEYRQRLGHMLSAKA